MTDWKNLRFGVLSRRGSSERRVIRRDDDGTVAGVETEHWDDHVDAVVTPKSLRLEPFKNREG
jgi:hypothetical protein